MRETLPLGGHHMYDKLVGRRLQAFYGRLAAAMPVGTRVLDIGCGPGHLAQCLAQHHPEAQVIGGDLDAAQVKIARRRTAPNLQFLQEDVRQMTFPAKHFDLVVTSESFHHWTDPTRSVEEVARVLRPGGSFWILEGSGDMTRQEVRAWSGMAWPGWPWICRRVFRKHGYTEAQVKANVLPHLGAFGRVHVERMDGWHIIQATL